MVGSCGHRNTYCLYINTCHLPLCFLTYSCGITQPVKRRGGARGGQDGGFLHLLRLLRSALLPSCATQAVYMISHYLIYQDGWTDGKDILLLPATRTFYAPTSRHASGTRLPPPPHTRTPSFYSAGSVCFALSFLLCHARRLPACGSTLPYFRARRFSAAHFTPTSFAVYCVIHACISVGLPRTPATTTFLPSSTRLFTTFTIVVPFLRGVCVHSTMVIQLICIDTYHLPPPSYWHGRRLFTQFCSFIPHFGACDSPWWFVI